MVKFKVNNTIPDDVLRQYDSSAPTQRYYDYDLHFLFYGPTQPYDVSIPFEANLDTLYWVLNKTNWYWPELEPAILEALGIFELGELASWNFEPDL